MPSTAALIGRLALKVPLNAWASPLFPWSFSSKTSRRVGIDTFPTCCSSELTGSSRTGSTGCRRLTMLPSPTVGRSISTVIREPG